MVEKMERPSDKLLQAAKKVIETEQKLARARAEYEEVFNSIVSSPQPQPVVALRSSEPRKDLSAALLAASSVLFNARQRATNGQVNLEGSTVLQRVHKFVKDQSEPQSAATVVAGTKIPEPSVRWAFVKLVERGVLKKEARGRYVATEETSNDVE